MAYNNKKILVILLFVFKTNTFNSPNSHLIISVVDSPPLTFPWGEYNPGGSGWIISVGDYADNSFAAMGSSDPREVRLEL